MSCVVWQKDGVKIYIQLYKEVTLAVQLGSEFTVNILSHPNIVVSIRVLRRKRWSLVPSPLCAVVLLSSVCLFVYLFVCVCLCVVMNTVTVFLYFCCFSIL